MAFLAYFVRNVTLCSLFIFDKVFINWGTCLQELGYHSSCLFDWYICLCAFWYICFQIVFAYKVFFFYFVASVIWLHCFCGIFLLLWCICFHINFAHRFHIRGLNIHMASIHGNGIGLQFFLLLYTKCSGQEFLDNQTWVYSLHICGCVSFFVALTRSTRLEYWIYMVLMNLQDIGQMGIEVAQCERRATGVQVCSLNPAGWSILWMHGL